MIILLDESSCRQQLFPFSHTRHVADIRIGILTIREKWERLTGEKVITENASSIATIRVCANVIPTIDNYEAILSYSRKGHPVAEDENIKILVYPWNIFQYNEWSLRQDFTLITANKKSQVLSSTNRCTNEQQLFIEEGAVVEHCIINTDTGPVYLGKDSLVMEGSLIRGPFALCNNGVLKMGSKIYGSTTIGPGCIAGGEIKNSVLFGYSNKAHEGYLGDSVIGEWCNLGAGTSNSNVKNTGGAIHYHLHPGTEPIYAGNKAGLLMGDYSRSAINTSFNTGTVVGVCCNIFGNCIPPRHVKNFSWGPERYHYDKVLADINAWKKMKGHSLDDEEIKILKDLYLTNT